jgi:small subunit ribosomal protein S19e
MTLTGILFELVNSFHIFSVLSFIIYVAAVARKLYLKQGLGVGALQRIFGGGYRRGTKTNHHHDASQGIIRNVVLMLDEIKLTEKCPNGGRKISRIGQQALDLVAGQVARGEV